MKKEYFQAIRNFYDASISHMQGYPLPAFTDKLRFVQTTRQDIQITDLLDPIYGPSKCAHAIISLSCMESEKSQREESAAQ